LREHSAFTCKGVEDEGKFFLGTNYQRCSITSMNNAIFNHTTVKTERLAYLTVV
jgi:hypothetical protein